MFRFTKLLIEPNFTGYSSNIAILKYNVELLCSGRIGGKEMLRNRFYRHYGPFFTSRVVAESHQNKKNINNSVHVHNLRNERKMSGTSTGTTDDKDKLKPETDHKVQATEQSKGVTVKRRRYVRNFPRIKFQSVEDKTHRAPVKKRSRKHILDPPKPNVMDTANVESSPKTTEKLAEGESNILNELSESIEKAQESTAKEPLPSKQVHIEYIESVNRNPDDAVKDSDNIDAKPEINLIKKIEEQINDPMIIKLILRSQLVPETSDKTEKPEEESSNTLLDPQIDDTQKRHSDHNKKPINETKIRIILPPDESNNSSITPAQSNEQSKSESELEATNTKIIEKSESSAVPQPAMEDEDIIAKKMALRTSTEAEVFKNISVKLDSPLKVRNDSQWSGKQNTQTWFEKKAEKIKLKAKVDTTNETVLTNAEQTLQHDANKLNDFVDNKSKTVDITDDISHKRDDSTSGHMYKDQDNKSKTVSITDDIGHKRDDSTSGHMNKDQDNKSKTVSITDDIGHKRDDSTSGHMNKDQDNKSKTVSITDDIGHKRDDSTSGHMYKDQDKKSKTVSITDDIGHKRDDSTSGHMYKDQDKKSKTVSITDDIGHKRDDSTSGHMYKDQARKLDDLLNARPETIITDKSKTFETGKSEATRGSNITVGSGGVGGSGSGGGRSRGTTAHYIREKPSKVKVYFRNVSYILMTIIGSFSIYYLAEMLSHEDALSLAFISDWQNKEAALAVDAEDESQDEMVEDSMALEALDLSLMKQEEESLPVEEEEDIKKDEDNLYVGEEGY